MEVTGQLDGPAALPPVKLSPVFTSNLDVMEPSLLPLPGIEPQFVGLSAPIHLVQRFRTHKLCVHYPHITNWGIIIIYALTNRDYCVTSYSWRHLPCSPTPCQEDPTSYETPIRPLPCSDIGQRVQIRKERRPCLLFAPGRRPRPLHK
jgi:hypothetical protein